MLERRAFENKRLLGAFNVDVDNWMYFFTYTDIVDRDGKSQLHALGTRRPPARRAPRRPCAAATACS
jgi:hypothetical protein